MNFAEEFEAAADGEAIECAIIGPVGDCYGSDSPTSAFLGQILGTILPWSEARSMLLYDAELGTDINPVFAFTATRVLFVHGYDGQIVIRSIPRNPADSPMPEIIS